ncbi:MAG: hypothetical protein CVU60_15310 [Deltaproteobacteria bacterium HGW-Deltaproteobacteria-18]|jgi:hypothetical protein|nr:MAG: hypothetical protein CVU60_15310 [Deltaproteobacteria bacterium HGW-Deltaproteobacteria-18]
MLVCNSIDTICLTINLDRQTQMYLLNWQFRHNLIPKGIYPTDAGIPRYKWGLEHDGIRIYYSDSEVLKPNCFIRFSSEYIQRVGYQKAYARCCGLLKSFGVHRPGRGLKLSQIDLAFDFQSDLSRYLDNPAYHVKTRLQNTVSRNEAEGLVWRLWGVGGSRGYKVRVYDKRQEASAVVGKEYWHEVWTNQGFTLEEPIWRIEYEMHRDFLKEWKIERLSQFLNAQQSIQKRLFDLWSIKIRDDSNVSRCSNVPEYEYLIEHFSQDFIEHEVDRRPEAYERAADQQLIRAVNALVASVTNKAAAFFARGHKVLNAETLVSQRVAGFNRLIKETSLGSPEQFLLAATALLQKKGYYYTPAHQMLEVAA